MNINSMLPAGNAGSDVDGDDCLFSMTFSAMAIFDLTVTAKFFIW